MAANKSSIGDNKMYETVKTVNGHDIIRAVGTRRFYYVIIKDFGDGCKKYATFHTIKAAAQFCETL
jgi:hypothetical protein